MSDWGATHSTVGALNGGLDLEMPGDGGASDARLVAAVEGGACAAEDVDTALYLRRRGEGEETA